jgi:hypothetical protein
VIGTVVVWNSTTFEKLDEFKAHDELDMVVSHEGSDPANLRWPLALVP